MKEEPHIIEQRKQARRKPIYAKQMALVDICELNEDIELWVETGHKGIRKWMMEHGEEMTQLRRVPITCKSVKEAQNWMARITKGPMK